MIQTLYRIMPSSLRMQIFRKVSEQAIEGEEARSIALEQNLPHFELDTQHIQNLKILTNRSALLGVLPANAVVAEIGVAEGDFSEEILSITKPKELHLIDSWAHDVRYDNLRPSVEARFVTNIKCDQLFVHQGLSTTELSKFADHYFDWIYLDASHEYMPTAEELEHCRHKVKPNGIIAGHDYVTGYWHTKLRYGVIEAVHEFCVKHSWELLYLTHESHRHLSFAIRKIVLG